MSNPHFTPSTDPAFPPYTEPPYKQTHGDGTVQESFQDAWGRYWIYYHRPDGTVDRMTTDSGDPSDLSEWRDAEPGEEPTGRSTIYQQDSRPLEETTPLFGPGDQTPDPPDDPTRLPGHWDPVGLRWVNDEPTMKSAGIFDDGRTSTRDESRAAADEDSSVADLKVDLGDDEVAGPLRSGHWDPRSLQWVPDEPTSSVGRILGDESTQDPVEGGGAGGSAEGEGGEPPPVELPPSMTDPLAPDAPGRPTDPADQYREGHWDPRSLRWVYDEPTSSVGKVLDDAAEGFDPSGPLDQASRVRLGSQIEQPTQEPPPEEPPPPEPGDEGEGTAAAPFSVDSTSFEGSTARGFDPSVPLDRADPNLQSLDSSLFDLNAPGPTLDHGLFDEAEPGPTLDPGLFDSNAPGPTLDPGLFDLNSPGPTVDSALFDERSPGPTLDPGLLDPDSPGPTLDANRLDPSAPGDTLDEAQLERASERPSSVEEPTDVTGRGDTNPSPMEEPAHPEPSTPRHEDHDGPLDVG